MSENLSDRDLEIELPYGKGALKLYTDIRNVNIVVSKTKNPLENLKERLRESLENPIGSPPLRELCERARRITILIPDKTRAFPSRSILPLVLELIEKTNPVAQVSILVATGLHQPHSKNEILELVGKDVYENYEVFSHDAEDKDLLIDIGKRTSYGTPVVFNRKIVEADVVVGLGLIEPHFFAGHSGGRKSILPGVAGKMAIYVNHGYKMIAHPNSRYGILKSNPIHEDMVEFMKLSKLDFIVNVTINKEKKITGIFCGDPLEAHLVGVRFLEEYVKVEVKGLADIVVATNGGYPLDRNLYQAVKGMATAELLVKEGGVIITVAECRDGLGGHADFYKLFVEARDPDEVLEKIRRLEPIKDQWEAQILARILKRAKVIVVSKVKQDIVEDMFMIPATNVDEALEEASQLIKHRKRDIKLTVVPEGPYVIPKITHLNT